MAARILEVPVPTRTGVDRAVHILSIPNGATILGLRSVHAEAGLVVKRDPGAALKRSLILDSEGGMRIASG